MRYSGALPDYNKSQTNNGRTVFVPAIPVPISEPLRAPIRVNKETNTHPDGSQTIIIETFFSDGTCTRREEHIAAPNRNWQPPAYKDQSNSFPLPNPPAPTQQSSPTPVQNSQNTTFLKRFLPYILLFIAVCTVGLVVGLVVVFLTKDNSNSTEQPLDDNPSTNASNTTLYPTTPTPIPPVPTPISPTTTTPAPSSPTSTKCPLCYGGKVPQNPYGMYVGGYNCSEIEALLPADWKSDDDECLGQNAQAVWLCGCPDLPPPRAIPLCSLCANGAFPPPNADALVDYGTFNIGRWNLTCTEQAVRLTYGNPDENWIPYTSCQGFQDGFGPTCGC